MASIVDRGVSCGGGIQDCMCLINCLIAFRLGEAVDGKDHVAAVENSTAASHTRNSLPAENILRSVSIKEKRKNKGVQCAHCGLSVIDCFGVQWVIAVAPTRVISCPTGCVGNEGLVMDLVPPPQPPCEPHSGTRLILFQTCLRVLCELLTSVPSRTL